MGDKMKPYLIVLDLDGTLMLDFEQYDIETIDYLKALKAKGHIIMLATGRPLRSSYFVYEALGLDTPLINYNGAKITNPKDPLYPQTDLRIDRNDLLDIIEFIRPNLINVFCEIGDDIYVQDYNPTIHSFLHINDAFGSLYAGELKDILPDNPNGALFFLKKEAITSFQQFIEQYYTSKLLSRFWQVDQHYIVEIYNPLVDKSVGFEDACRYYHIPKERTIAIGDGHNDIGLLQAASIGVAMGNAHPDLIPFATTLTHRFDQQGVLHFLKSFFEKEK